MTRGESMNRVMPLSGPRVASSVSMTRLRSLTLGAPADGLDDSLPWSWKRTDLPVGSLSESPDSKLRMKRDRKRELRRESVDVTSLS